MKGNHLLAGEELSKDIHSRLGNDGVLMIPRYIIVGSDGKIAYADAAGPNEQAKALEQLKSAF